MTKEMIPILPLWTFLLYISLFQQHMHMQYIYLSVDPIFQGLWFLSWFPWYRVAANKEAIEPRVPNYIDVLLLKLSELYVSYIYDYTYYILYVKR